MSYTAFDPRESIREKIGTEWDTQRSGTTDYCLNITSSYGDTIYVPMFLAEEVQSNNLPAFPYMEFVIASTSYEPHDVGARTRKMEMYIDVHFYFTDMDNISRKDFAKKVKDELHNQVRTNQCDFTGITFINVETDDYLPETDGRQIIYHYIFTIYCLYYDLP